MQANLSPQWKLYSALVNGIGLGYNTAEPRVLDRLLAKSKSGYNPDVYGFRGGELEHITSRNYEKALRNIWKAETKAPYLGIKDASKWEKAELQQAEETEETQKMIELVTSKQVIR